MAWMPSYGSANKETSEQFGTGQISDFDRRDVGDQCSKRGFTKRSPASRHIHWSQPSSPKRYRTNSGSCIAIDFFNFDTRAFGEDDMFANDDWLSVNSSNHSSNLSASYPSNFSTNTYPNSYQSTNYPGNFSSVAGQQVMSQPQMQQHQQQQQQQPQQQQFQQMQYQYTNSYQQQLQTYQHPAPPAPPSLPAVDDARNQQQQRLEKTTEILKEGGLYDVAVKTATLIRQHEKSKKELEELRAQTKLFLEEVLNNPENQKVNQVLQTMHHQQANPQLSAEKAVRDLFDQCNPSNAS